MADPGTTDAARTRSLAAVLASAFSVGLTIGMATPLVTLTLQGRGYDSVTIGLVAGSYAAAILGAGPFVPRLAARLGTVPTLVIGSLLAAASLALFPFIDTLALVILLRVAMGMGNACDWIVSETWINSLARPADRGRIVALYATIWGLGVGIGPLLLAATGTAGPLPYLVAAGLLTAAIPPVLLARRIAPPLGHRVLPGGVRAVLRRAPLALGAGVLSGLSEAAFFALFPVHALGLGRAEATVVLFASTFAVGSIALQPPVGWLADRTDRRRLLAGSVALALLCVAGVAAFMDGGWVIWPIVFVWGGAVAGFYTLGLILLGETFSSGDLPSANAAFVMAYTAGMAVGPIVAGAALAAFPRHGLLAVMAAACLAFLVAMAIRPAVTADRRPGA